MSTQDNINEINILRTLSTYPLEIIELVKTYIPLYRFYQTNRENYAKYHNYIRKYISKPEFENYIRSTVRRDHPFVFQQILDENYKKWFTIKRYEYRNVIYMNYVYFLISYCIDNDSPKCKMILTQLLEELGLSKNQYKKNITKSIRWKQ